MASHSQSCDAHTSFCIYIINLGYLTKYIINLGYLLNKTGKTKNGDSQIGAEQVLTEVYISPDLN